MKNRVLGLGGHHGRLPWPASAKAERLKGDIRLLFTAIDCAAGKRISDVTLVRVSSKKFIDYRVRIEVVMISAIEVDGPDEKGRILENVSLIFSRCTWEFHDTNPDGSLGPAIIKKFDLKLNGEIY